MAALKEKKAVPVTDKKGKKANELPHHRAYFATSNAGVPKQKRKTGDFAREPKKNRVRKAVGRPLGVFQQADVEGSSSSTANIFFGVHQGKTRRVDYGFLGQEVATICKREGYTSPEGKSGQAVLHRRPY
jgi:hypothetical protein